MKHFEELAQDGEEGEFLEKPLQRLSYPLMHRLLSSGFISVPTDSLLRVVQEFVSAKLKEEFENTGCLHDDSKSASDHCRFDGLLLPLVPPNVLFNHQVRAGLMSGLEMDASAFASM